MKFDDYIVNLTSNKKLSSVKLIILKKLWCDEVDAFPKPWISSAELLELTNQKYFDRRARELRDQHGCDVESAYNEELKGHAWRLTSSNLLKAQDREYLTNKQKNLLFKLYDFKCATCGISANAGIRGLQADHKIPLSRKGSNDLSNWQPLCNSCNIGKRRACDGCELECSVCAWSFPESTGIVTMINVNPFVINRVNDYGKQTGETISQIFEKAAEYYLDSKKKGS